MEDFSPVSRLHFWQSTSSSLGHRKSAVNVAPRATAAWTYMPQTSCDFSVELRYTPHDHDDLYRTLAEVYNYYTKHSLHPRMKYRLYRWAYILYIIIHFICADVQVLRTLGRKVYENCTEHLIVKYSPSYLGVHIDIAWFPSVARNRIRNPW